MKGLSKDWLNIFLMWLNLGEFNAELDEVLKFFKSVIELVVVCIFGFLRIRAEMLRLEMVVELSISILAMESSA